MIKGIGFSRLLVGIMLVGAFCPAAASAQVTEAPGGNTTVAAKTDLLTNEDIVVAVDVRTRRPPEAGRNSYNFITEGVGRRYTAGIPAKF